VRLRSLRSGSHIEGRVLVSFNAVAGRGERSGAADFELGAPISRMRSKLNGMKGPRYAPRILCYFCASG